MKSALLFFTLVILGVPVSANELCDLEDLVRIEDLSSPIDNGPTMIERLRPFLRPVPIKHIGRGVQIHGEDFVVMYEQQRQVVWVGATGGYVDSTKWYGPLKISPSAVQTCDKIALEIRERKRQCIAKAGARISDLLESAKKCD